MESYCMDRLLYLVLLCSFDQFAFFDYTKYSINPNILSNGF